MKMAKLGILFDEYEAELKWSTGENLFENYLFEIIDRFRIPYEKVGILEDFNTFDVLIVLQCSGGVEVAKKILEYVHSGGTIISYAGLENAREILGFAKTEVLEKGYANLACFFNQNVPLRFLHAEPWESENNSSKVTDIGFLNEKIEGKRLSALQRINHGKGVLDRWTVAIPKSIVYLQQGTQPVNKDGIPAPDGSANLDENILKAEDGFELDWDKDRTYTETGMPYFPYPYADLWKEVIVEHLFKCVIEKGLTLPFVDFWPTDVKYIATISHDSDLNVDESAQITLDTLKSENVQTTWCMIAPGYDSLIYEQIKSDGHEIAFHYNALEQENGVWSEEAFKSQLEWIKNSTSTEDIISNKNHYTRFEGWGELYSWCEKNGIQVDQTRGPSKKGNIGFLFGTCHPYFPIALADEKNRLYDVLEIGFLTQDLNHNTLSDSSVIQPFLDGVKSVNGVAHFLFHQFHIYNQPKVREALLQLITSAKSQGFTFWTSRQINDWERERRKLSITGISGSGQIEITGLVGRNDFVLLVPFEEDKNLDINQGETVTRFGFKCKQIFNSSNVLEEA
ncbi:hypothetical protein WAX74_02170 [Psychrobacillus sp. FJAT-51614]|uniref:NodB homology domain-containing protein n=1 Tax=Psychrobacillus mangrovi TaxID=3117745 RepID=A0ABU8F2H8_9BACI